MSWSGFKKNLNRATTTVLSKTGNIDKTSDREFDEEERRLKLLEAKAEKLHKEARGYVDAVRGMTGAQLRIASTIDQFYDEGAPMGIYGVKYKEAVTKLDEQAREDIDSAYRTTVLEPIGRFAAYFPEINEGLRRRQKKLIDYDTARAKVRKLVEKPSEDASRLPRAEMECNASREVYETIHAQLTAELPKVMDSRIAYLDPSFEAVVKSQLAFAQDAHTTLDNLRQFFPQEAQGYELEESVDGILRQMRELTICGLA
ncbi:hypothetical protein DFQ27_007054 [Actinomortierella ambigua]|uniref:BAR domain-containing protein n=1 Tax=Actinomortierella ambigua TaxID=1343610 RepID=A0A9P6QJ03_9FUNG|nr:hypothetical protein DFQ26_007664 [Actinomortierella ambigua]KAG0268318.1 hypothetical protein DFQ27_007054 [Actinomortierella ambigua]